MEKLFPEGGGGHHVRSTRYYRCMPSANLNDATVAEVRIVASADLDSIALTVAVADLLDEGRQSGQ